MKVDDKVTFTQIIGKVLLWFGVVVMVLPFIWMLSTSFKIPSEVLSWPPKLIPKTFSWVNYVEVFKTVPFGRFFLNSIMMSSVSATVIIFTSVLGGYIFAKFDFPAKGLIFAVILATAMVPFETFMIPLYLQMVKLGWVNTFIGLVGPYLVMSYGIFFMRQNIKATVPDDLLNAARIDGLGEFGIFYRVVFPLMGGSSGALAIFAFMQAWAAFIWPLIITSDRKLWTTELGLGMFQNKYTIDLGPINAGSIISIFPVLMVFFFFRRNIMSSMTLSGMKA